MKIAIISDAWFPQVNGVVRTLSNLQRMLERVGHEVLVMHPDRFAYLRCPGYPSIHIALRPYRRLRALMDAFEPDAVHIATEGPVGLAGRKYCRKRKLRFTSSYHTQFPHYFKLYFGLPVGPAFRFLRWFHRPAVRTLVPTDSVRSELAERGFEHLEIWGRGIDLSHFRPVSYNGQLEEMERPIFLNVGRVSPEKNLEAFAELDLPGTKIVVGEGPARSRLIEKYPKVVFTGHIADDDLPAYYTAADVFVFPSRTDTFGNVMLEAMACGTPVAAYPVTGPIDVVQSGQTGVLDEDLAAAAMSAMDCDGRICRRYAESLPWSRLVRQFEGYLVEARSKAAVSRSA